MARTGGPPVILAAVVAAALAGAAVAVARSGVSRIDVLRPPPTRPVTRLGFSALRTAPSSRAREVAIVASALAGEVRAGREPEQAWRHVVVDSGLELPGAAVADADVLVVLTRWAAQPGWSGLSAVAVCWELADMSGAGLAEALERVAESMRHEQEIAAEVQGQLATTRATAVVLATLPLLAVVMGSLLGADLLGVLLGSWLGGACLAAGLLLSAAGAWWVARQVAAVHRVLRWQ